MQTVQLGGLKRGIDRTRLRGAGVNGALYDLTNAYLTISGSVKKRPPFKKVAKLDATTVGLFGNNGMLHTFYTGAALTSPDAALIEYDQMLAPSDATTVLKAIKFDALYLGRQYVIAEWDDGRYWSYWLPASAASGGAQLWQANHDYNVNARVQPTVPNGYFYAVGNNDFPQAWQPATRYAVGDVVVPSTYNGWKYTCTLAAGANPASGATEPKWPTSNGATVTEEHGDAGTPAAAPSAPTSNPSGNRYGNPA